MEVVQNSKDYHSLVAKWSKKHADIQKQIVDKHGLVLSKIFDRTKGYTAATVGGLLLLTTTYLQPPDVLSQKSDKPITISIDKRFFLVHDLEPYIPDDVRLLTSEEEATISAILARDLGISITPEIEGKRLERSYGYIGAEQHLMRYPGDTMGTHFDSPSEASEYWSSGMAPGRGAWGYFSPSALEFSEKDKQREKYYIAVQTFLSPDYNQRTAEYRDFFKFRKMLLVNPHNGKAIVTVIGDVGPAVWTGKHLGGSPEVMKHLERVDGRQKGPVLFLFIDDPKDSVPLGPIDIQ
ncbi:MAG TPA: hypothetical protein VJC10_02540 [Patescibacteria group bacterium]|nr:hypothetical protein [Patescibacteria group bacterium]